MDGFKITSQLTFDAGVNATNFDDLRKDLKTSIADSLNIEPSMITLKFINGTERLRRMIGTIVEVTIRIKEKSVAEELRNHLTTNATSFISTMTKKIGQIEALKDAGVVVTSVTKVECTETGKLILIIEHIKISSIIKYRIEIN